MKVDEKKLRCAVKVLAEQVGLRLDENDGLPFIKTGLMVGDHEGLQFRLVPRDRDAPAVIGFLSLEVLALDNGPLVDAIDREIERIRPRPTGVSATYANAHLPPRLTYTGAFSVYFNRHVDAPRVWIVAAVDRAWEVNVVSVAINVPIVTKYDPAPHRPDHDGPPSAWFEGYGVVVVDVEGRATIGSAP